MPWPQPTDYNAAIQAPSSFADADLRAARPVVDPVLGLPRLHSGNFADVYQLNGPDGASWAVKCFTRETKGLAPRYRALSQHLRQVGRPFLVDFTFLEQGICIRGDWYPVLKMQWVEGYTLSQFVERFADQKVVMSRLAYLWLKLSRELREAKIGHGDLQHSNILMVPGGPNGNTLTLRVLDYDGLWVPSLAEFPSEERGHPHYQHPLRVSQGGYGPEIDRFSLLSVYTALRAVRASGKALWRRYDNSENLLFREIDFSEPERSELLHELATHADPAVRTLVGYLVLSLRRAPEQAPRLDRLIEDDVVQPLNEAEEAEVFDTLRLVHVARRKSRVLVAVDSAASPTVDSEASTSEHMAEADTEEHRNVEPAPRPAMNSPKDRGSSKVPPPSAEQRRAAASQFERANQVVAKGSYDYGLHLLLSCCTLDPANLIYRQALRRTAKARYRNNMRGHWLAWLTTIRARLRVRRALKQEKHLKVLEHGEQILLRAPWDVPTQMQMSSAADELGLLDLAVWFLEQARQKTQINQTLNRALASLYERRGNFTQAIAMWEQVHRVQPNNSEAWQKFKDLAASETIARGNYGNAVEAGTARLVTPSAQHKPLQPTAAERPADAPPLPQNNRLAREATILLERRKQDPTNTLLHQQLALVYRKADMLEEARRVLIDGLNATGNAFELASELADLDIEALRRDHAVAEQQLKGKPNDAELRKVCDRLAKEIGTRELELFRQKSDRFPAEKGHRLEIGIRLYRLGQIDEAIKELQSIRDDARLACRAYQYLGQCFLARNNLNLAQRNFEDALRLLPTNDSETRKDLLYQMAQTAARAGNVPRAIELAQDLAYLDFAYRDISSLLEEWQRQATAP